MLTPYDWQEGINNRIGYIQGRLENGAPVLAVSLDAGILIFTYKRQSGKIFEIYDRLAFAGLGQQSDIESIRVMALEFAHREGYNRSEQDVTIQRVVTSVSAPIKKAFSDFSYAPILALSLFAELGTTPADDQFYVVDYEGDYHLYRGSALISGQKHEALNLNERIPAKTKPETAAKTVADIWLEVMSQKGEQEVNLEGLTPDILLMDRKSSRENVFVPVTL